MAHDVLIPRQGVHIVAPLVHGIRFQASDAHAFFHLRLAGQGDLDFRFPRHAVDHGTGPAEPAPAAAAPDQFEARVFHGVHDGLVLPGVVVVGKVVVFRALGGDGEAGDGHIHVAGLHGGLAGVEGHGL